MIYANLLGQPLLVIGRRGAFDNRPSWSPPAAG
jgi:hypothetical protein